MHLQESIGTQLQKCDVISRLTVWECRKPEQLIEDCPASKHMPIIHQGAVREVAHDC